MWNDTDGSVASGPPRAGVYSVTCSRTGRTYVGWSDDLARTITETRDTLTAGRHPDPVMQADWAVDAGRAFEFAIHDEIPPEECVGDLAERLGRLRDLWIDELDIHEGRTY
ncbi:hypothetical protein KEM60_01509 [Austwickia sp. TVS 96-490-7B]|uniref:GIY-YIG nuclease family protein n=1 Tax=Austwickia sp. TVS 96-490-7B TaxID=2830843 RepID=UPI001C560808|nr:GIY-YIG nuclease family protein [Austwickia sp. TVS 96-490-7B]MBW3085312.1 hypothetical protein [Austwickia sp. TVS 96-490-7B]